MEKHEENQVWGSTGATQHEPSAAELGEALGEPLGEVGGALGELWEALYIEKLPINRPSGRYVISSLRSSPNNPHQGNHTWGTIWRVLGELVPRATPMGTLSTESKNPYRQAWLWNKHIPRLAGDMFCVFLCVCCCVFVFDCVCVLICFIPTREEGFRPRIQQQSKKNATQNKSMCIYIYIY